MSHRDEYRQWPFLTQEEFELACAFFDQRYVKAKLGPTRQIFKIRSRRTATSGCSYIEILRLLQLSEDQDDLSFALEKLSGGGDPVPESKMDTVMIDEDEDQASNDICCGFGFFRLTQDTGGAASGYKRAVQR